VKSSFLIKFAFNDKRKLILKNTEYGIENYMGSCVISKNNKGIGGRKNWKSNG